MLRIDDPTIQHGRVVVTRTPVSSPGNCGVCGYAGQDRYYVDFRLDFEFYGTLYFCESCVAEPAILLGWTTPAVHDRLLESINQAGLLIAALTARNEELEATLDVLAAKRVASSVNPLSVSNNLGDVSVVKPERGNQPPAVRVSQAAGVSANAAKNANVSGSNDASNLERDKFALGL